MLHLRRLEGIEGTQKTYFFHFDVLKSESRISCKKVGGRKQKEAQELSGVNPGRECGYAAAAAAA